MIIMDVKSADMVQQPTTQISNGVTFGKYDFAKVPPFF